MRGITHGSECPTKGSIVLRRVLLPATVIVLAMLSMASTASAAPPAHGQRAPELQAPTSIADGHVGPVIVGPRSFCGPVGTGTVQAANTCIDVVRRGCQMWRRSGTGSPWRRGRVVYNDTTEVFFTGPYSPGFQWVWSFGDGFGVMATRCLYRYEPLFG
jgi:hypothetical protein